MDNSERLPSGARIKTYGMMCPEGGYTFAPDENMWSLGSRWIKCAELLDMR